MFAASVALAAPNCDVHAVDRCLTKVVPFANRTSLGVTPEGFVQECHGDREALKCLKSFAESGCVKGQAVHGFKALLTGTATESALRCQEGTERFEEYFQYVPCANKAGVALNRCMRQNTAYVEAAAGAGEFRVPQTCCSFTRLAACADAALAEAMCDAKTSEYFRSVLYGITGRFLDASCGAFKLGAEECKTLPVLATGEPKYTTVFGPLVEFFASQ